MPKNAVGTENLNAPSPEEVSAELDTILLSPGFERSERIQRFLRFICELTLKGESSRINEYLIGSEVFQRGPSYSPSEDSVVRRQALTLRQKLQEYYATEGRDHHVRIELPVGRYIPVFRKTEATVKSLPDPPPPAAAPPDETKEEVSTAPARLLPIPRIGLWILACSLVFLAGMAAGAAAFSSRSNAAADSLGPAIREVWGPWLREGSETVICFSNPMTTVVKHFAQPLPPDTLPRRMRATGDEDEAFRRVFRISAGGFFYHTPAINQTKMGEAIAGVHLSALLTKAGVNVQSTQSRFLNWEDLRKADYVLLGHNEANHWLEPILKDFPFQLVGTTDGRPRGIINSRPAQGEPPEYRINYSREDSEGDEEYALVSFIPGISGNHRLILINGLNAQATQAATEYFTSESAMANLLARLKEASPNRRRPWLFQAIIKTEVYDKVPSRSTLVAVRAL